MCQLTAFTLSHGAPSGGHHTQRLSSKSQPAEDIEHIKEFASQVGELKCIRRRKCMAVGYGRLLQRLGRNRKIGGLRPVHANKKYKAWTLDPACSPQTHAADSTLLPTNNTLTTVYDETWKLKTAFSLLYTVINYQEIWELKQWSLNHPCQTQETPKTFSCHLHPGSSSMKVFLCLTALNSL